MKHLSLLPQHIGRTVACDPTRRSPATLPSWESAQCHIRPYPFYNSPLGPIKTIIGLVAFGPSLCQHQMLRTKAKADPMEWAVYGAGFRDDGCKDFKFKAVATVFEAFGLLRFRGAGGLGLLGFQSFRAFRV